jgi:hypothetical protein
MVGDIERNQRAMVDAEGFAAWLEAARERSGKGVMIERIPADAESSLDQPKP